MRKVVGAIASVWSRYRLTFPLALLVAGVSTLLAIQQDAALGDLGSQLLAGATFLAAAMVNALLRVWSWADANDARVAQLSGDVLREQPLRNDLRERFDALEQVQTVAAVATALSIALILALIVAIVHPPYDASTDQGVVKMVMPTANVWATRTAVALASAVAVCLLGIVADTVMVGNTSLKASRTDIGGQSGPNG